MNIKDLRKEYHAPDNRFFEDDLVAKEPIGQFRHWYGEASSDKAILQPNAMCLATSTRSGVPSARMVLLKGFDERGFEFFTNYSSRKGRELIENPQASLLFHWDSQDRQIRVEGRVEKLPAAESESYFQQRPRSSQISAAVSEQSSIVNREDLLRKHEAMTAAMADESIPVPKPETWGGFRLVPHVVEFFQGQSNRLHDRIRFRKPSNPNEKQPNDELVHRGDNGWVYERLAP